MEQVAIQRGDCGRWLARVAGLALLWPGLALAAQVPSVPVPAVPTPELEAPPPLPGPPAARGVVVRCESDGPYRVHCPMDIGDGVEMVRQLSERPCIRESDWGVDAGGVWVDRGCRAEFLAPLAPGKVTRRMIRCESRGRVEACPVMLRGAPVRLLRQTSMLPCTRNETWGVGRNQVWVSRGCKGEFEIGDREAGFPAGERQLTCESKDRRRRTCGTTIEHGARLLEQISGAPCEQGTSWDWEAEGIWVDAGCRARFAVQ